MNVDATAQQWLDYFATGSSFEFHYDLDGLRDHNRKNDQAVALGVDIPTMMVTGAISNAGVAACFGEYPERNPILGISQYGLHLPLYPLVKWQDIAAAWFSDLATTRERASNGFMIPEIGRTPGVFKGDKTDLTLIVRNARLIRSTITEESSFADMGLKISTTGSGQEWGELAVYLDPALSPEQVVQFYYLFSLLASQWSIPLHHSTGMFEGVGDVREIAEFLRAN